MLLFNFPQGTNNAPPELGWLLPGSVRSYAEVGKPNDSGQVEPVLVYGTKTLANLAEEKGASRWIWSRYRLCRRQEARQIGPAPNGSDATDVVMAAGP